MSQYRTALPQLEGSLFLADGGIETTLIFLEGLQLPYFAAFDLLKMEEGTESLRKYFRSYAAIAKRYGAGLILESATWRANPDWATKLGYSRGALAEVNRKSIKILEEIRNEYTNPGMKLVISGCLGPRGDGYNPTQIMSAKGAEEYHSAQIESFAGTAADLVTAITMNYVEEAIGIAQAAKKSRHAFRYFIHSRNRWQAPDRTDPQGCD